MKVLVVAASRHGATAEIAEAIGARLRERGHVVDVGNPAELTSPAGYGAVIIGSAVYAGSWLKDAREFVKRNADALSAARVWLFSSGPLDDSDSPVSSADDKAAAGNLTSARLRVAPSGSPRTSPPAADCCPCFPACLPRPGVETSSTQAKCGTPTRRPPGRWPIAACRWAASTLPRAAPPQGGMRAWWWRLDRSPNTLSPRTRLGRHAATRSRTLASTGRAGSSAVVVHVTTQSSARAL